jgi:KaiC/GvpD/RAD55 family RecA-like ATPase
LVFRPGELTLWTGATGTGKSQILSHALIAMADQGARVCLASLEMAPPQLLRRMVRQAGNTGRPTESFTTVDNSAFHAWADEQIGANGGRLPGESKAEALARVCGITVQEFRAMLIARAGGS